MIGTIGLVTGCAGTYRYEAAGRGEARIGAGAEAASAAPGGGGVAARANVRHDVIVRVSAPRAEQVAWRLQCGDDSITGVVGETAVEYQTRRLAELRAARDRERHLVGAIAGAALGQVAAQGRVATPVGDATVTARVDGQAAGAAVASAVVADDVALAPGDVGGGTYVDRTTLVPRADGTCGLAMWPADGGDPTGLVGAFEVTRVYRRDAELRARREVEIGQAMAARGALRGQLITLGADVQAHARAEGELRAHAEAELELRGRAEAEIRLRAEAQAEVRARAEAEIWGRAMTARGQLTAYLILQGSDPGHRRRVLEAQAQAELVIRQRAEDDQRRRDAEAAAIAAELGRREELAISARIRLRAILLTLGARERPPMPPPLDEDRGTAPAEDATWIDGRWQWSGAAWAWQAGYWSEVDHGGAVVGATIELVSGLTAGGGRAEVVDHRAATRPAVVDHRTEVAPAAPPAPAPAARDHRDAPPSPPHHDAPAPRDHRDSAPAARDHRK